MESGIRTATTSPRAVWTPSTSTVTSTTTLRTESGCCHTLDISAFGEADQDGFILNQVSFAEFLFSFGGDPCTTIITIFFR